MHGKIKHIKHGKIIQVKVKKPILLQVKKYFFQVIDDYEKITGRCVL